MAPVGAAAACRALRGRIGARLAFECAHASFLAGESSCSSVGRDHVWILQGSLALTFVPMGLAAMPRQIASPVGLAEALPRARHASSLGAGA